MKYWGFLSAILGLLMSFHALAANVEIPTYTWQPHGKQAAGIYVRGDVVWQSVPCSETERPTTARLQHFPIIKTRMLLGKAIDQYEGYYCWNMQVPEEYVGQLVHMSLIRVFGKSKLWINYESVWSQSNESDRPERIDFLYHVRSPILRVELSLACGESPLCGFRGSFKVRTELEGGQIEQRSRSLDFFAFAGLAFCFIYHFVFAFLRRRYNAAMMIALMSFCLCLRIILTGQGQLHTYFHMHEAFYWRIEVLTVNLLIPSTISMSRAIFPLDSSATIEKTAWTLAALAISLLTIAESSWFLPLMLITYVMIFMAIASFVITIKNGLKNHRSATAIFAVAALIITGSTGLEVLNTRVNIELIPGTHPMGFLLSSIISSVLFSKRISEAFAHAELQEQRINGMTSKLSEDIALFDQRIEDRTRTIRLLIESLPTGIILINSDDGGQLKVNGSYSKFLIDKLGVGVHDWPSFHAFLARLHKGRSLKSVHELEQDFATLLLQKESPEQVLQGLAPESCTLEVMAPSPKKVEALELRMVWVPIRNGDALLGVYLFVLDITSLTRLRREALRLETELGAMAELMQLSSGEAALLREALMKKDHKELHTLARDRNLHLLQTLMKRDEAGSATLSSYRDTLDLLLRSFFKSATDPSFDLRAFLQHPLWLEHVSKDEYQRYRDVLLRDSTARAS